MSIDDMNGLDIEIVEFVKKIKSIIDSNGFVDDEIVLTEFRKLSDIDQAAIVTSVISHDEFKIEEHPDVYNEISLIKIKRHFFDALTLVLLIIFSSMFISFFLPNSIGNSLISDFINQLKYVYDLIFVV